MRILQTEEHEVLPTLIAHSLLPVPISFYERRSYKMQLEEEKATSSPESSNWLMEIKLVEVQKTSDRFRKVNTTHIGP